MRSDLVFEAMARVSGRFLLTKVVSKTTRKTPQTKYSHTGHDEFCICPLQSCQPNSRRAAYPATDSRSVAPRKLRRRPSALVQSVPYRGEWYQPLNALGSNAIDTY
jgi:hypothetical protein